MRKLLLIIPLLWAAGVCAQNFPTPSPQPTIGTVSCLVVPGPNGFYNYDAPQAQVPEYVCVDYEMERLATPPHGYGTFPNCPQAINTAFWSGLNPGEPNYPPVDSNNRPYVYVLWVNTDFFIQTDGNGNCVYDTRPVYPPNGQSAGAVNAIAYVLAGSCPGGSSFIDTKQTECGCPTISLWGLNIGQWWSDGWQSCLPVTDNVWFGVSMPPIVPINGDGE